MTSSDTAPPSVYERFLAAVRARDFDGIAACFAADALLRAVVPPGVREDVGPEAIADRYRRWLGEEGEYAVLDAAAEPFADVTRLRYTVAYADPELGRVVFEQTAYAEVADEAITAMRVACSGDRPLD